MPIYLRTTIYGKPIEHSINRNIERDKWSQTSGKMKGFSSDAKLLNGYLDTLKNKAHTLERELMRVGKEVNFDSFKEKWVGVPYEKHMINEVFQQHNDEVGMLVGKEFSPTTLKRYKTSLSHTQIFILWKFKKKDIEVSKLNYEFISNYSLWLKKVRNCNRNSAMKYLGNFKKIVQICLKMVGCSMILSWGLNLLRWK